MLLLTSLECSVSRPPCHLTPWVLSRSRVPRFWDSLLFLQFGDLTYFWHADPINVVRSASCKILYVSSVSQVQKYHPVRTHIQKYHPVRTHIVEESTNLWTVRAWSGLTQLLRALPLTRYISLYFISLCVSIRRSGWKCIYVWNAGVYLLCRCVQGSMEKKALLLLPLKLPYGYVRGVRSIPNNAIVP